MLLLIMSSLRIEDRQAPEIVNFQSQGKTRFIVLFKTNLFIIALTFDMSFFSVYLMNRSNIVFVLSTLTILLYCNAFLVNTTNVIMSNFTILVLII